MVAGSRAADAARWPPLLVAAVAATAALAAAAAAAAPKLVPAIGIAVVLTSALALGHRRLLSWRALLAAVIAVVFFIPIRRYELPGSLPFNLEPYRILVAFVALGWAASLLVDRRVRLVKTGLEPPLALISAAVIASILLNQNRINELLVQQDVTKKVTFFASFFLVVFIVASVVRSFEMLDFVVRVLVVCGAVIAASALVEAGTRYNVFNHLQGVIPGLHWQGLPYSLAQSDTRGGRLRVYASSEHPIAFAGTLVMLLPLAIYLVRKHGRRWWPALFVIFLACFATVSRTAIVMMLVVFLMYLWRRRRETLRLWPLVVPALAVVHLALPGTLGALKETFFPHGGIVAQQREGAGTRGSGRVADIGPALDQWSHSAAFGIGFGTRVIDKERQTANILDDEWLSTLLEVGAVGAVGWLWLFTRFARRLSRVARDDPGERGWLALGFASSVIAFAVGMLTYDALSFVQVTIQMFIYLGLGVALLRMEGDLTGRRTATA